MALHQAQKLIAIDRHRFRVVRCGRKFGKTEEAIEEIKGVALSRNSIKIGYVASTFGEARDIAWERLKRQLRSVCAVAPNDTRLEMKIMTQDGGTSEIQLKGWESIETWRGTEFDFIVLDEVQNYKSFWMYWTEVLRPTLIPRKGSALFLFTAKGFNHCYDLANLELKDQDFKSFHFTTYDNPYIPIEEIEKSRLEMTPERFEQEIMAEFTKTEGLVYKEFDRSQHIYTEEIRGFTEKVGGIDFGFTNPAAVLSIIVKDNVFYVSDELYKTGLTDTVVAEYVAAKGYAKAYPDPAGAAAIQELRQHKVNVREVIKGKDSIKNGINKIRELLLSNRIKIHTSCINLITEFETYSYPDNRKDHNESELPVDENNHALDALRYVIMMYTPSKPIINHQFHDKMLDIWQGR